MGSLNVGYKTGSGNVMEMTVHVELLNRVDIPVLSYNQCEHACQDGVGCNGKNGGCPPFAPHFGNIKPSMPKLAVVVVQYDTAWSVKYGGWRKKGVTTPALYISAYANALTDKYLHRLLKGIEEQGYYTIGASNCPGCSPKKCTVNHGEKCCKPKKRRYSMEATGVNCCDLHWDIFDEALPWLYGNTSEYIHTNMFRYAGVFCKEFDEELIWTVMKKDWSFCYVPIPNGRPSLEVYEDVHPEGSYDEGSTLEVYRIPLEEQYDFHS